MSVSASKWRVKIDNQWITISDAEYTQLKDALDDKSIQRIELNGLEFNKNQYKWAIEDKPEKKLSLEEKDRELKKIMIYDPQGKITSVYSFEKREREEELEYARPIIADIKARKELTVEQFLQEVADRYGTTIDHVRNDLLDDQKKEVNDIYVKVWKIRESDIDVRTKIVKEFYWRARLRRLFRKQEGTLTLDIFEKIIGNDGTPVEPPYRNVSLID